MIVALIGRANVGKSSLFNRFSDKKKAIVYDIPGVTRDRKYATISIDGYLLKLIDTPGLEEQKEMSTLDHSSRQFSIANQMMQQAVKAMEEADIICFIIDGKNGLHADDFLFAERIRKYNKPCLLVVNKCEAISKINQDYYSMSGLSSLEPIVISAIHGIGIDDLKSALVILIQNIIESGWRQEDQAFCDDIEKNGENIKIAIVGRPNSGKSTFVNSILSEARVLVSPQAGSTREAIDVLFEYKGRTLELIDTPGLRKKHLIHDQLEKLSVGDAIHNINFAHVVVLLLDAQGATEQQDLTIAEYAIRNGRSVVLVINKWDLVRDRSVYQKALQKRLDGTIDIKNLEAIFISALHKSNIEQVLQKVLVAYECWNTKISTSKLNEWLISAIKKHALPTQKGSGRVRIKYITQTKIRPPTFKLFANNPENVPDSYQRYLKNSLCQAFGLNNIPVRFILVKSHNPYV